MWVRFLFEELSEEREGLNYTGWDGVLVREEKLSDKDHAGAGRTRTAPWEPQRVLGTDLLNIQTDPSLEFCIVGAENYRSQIGSQSDGIRF